MNVILSIKPEFAAKILSGDKKFEFRKTAIKQEFNKMYLYVSSPICKIVGEVYIDEIILDNIDDLWAKTYKFAGIRRSFFDSYFANKKKGYAYSISRFIKYREPIDPKVIEAKFHAPQSFCYTKLSYEMYY